MKETIYLPVVILLVVLLALTGCNEGMVDADLVEDPPVETQSETSVSCVDIAYDLANSFEEASSSAATCESWKRAYRAFLMDCGDGFISNSIENVYDNYLEQVDCNNL